MAADYRGRPLLLHAIEAVSSVADEIVLVLAPDADAPGGLPVGVRISRDAEAYGGPLRGLAAGLAGVTTDLALVAGGDMPRLASSVLRKMCRTVESSDADAVALLEASKRRPLPLVLRTRVLSSVEELLDRGERSLKSLLTAIRVTDLEEKVWRALDPDGGTLLDVDLPADLDGSPPGKPK
ncbi:MAG: NTP transferase domain-containing protein [Actinomycetota bacterium]|nr:NTP transferase domain-containing protein [Actinomycetota bacterium]